MKQANDDIGLVLGEALNQHSQPQSFDSIWNTYHTKYKKKSGIKKQAAIIAIAIITLFIMGTAAAAGITRNMDRTNYPFINDPQVIGKWESVDFVKNINDFVPGKKSCEQDLYLTALAFTKNGKALSAADNGELVYSAFTWTKGKVLNKQENTASGYVVRNIDGSSYMFMEWKSGDYIFRNMTPYYYVLKKVNSDDYSNYQVIQKLDKIDYPFVDDNLVKGKWESVDFVKTIDGFNPGVKSWLDDLYLTGITFADKGRLEITTTAGESSRATLTWTKGMIIDKEAKTASKYEIKEMKGTTYMFYEWKNGDYVYGGKTPYYYVLKKIE